jgi:hypothetical protein
MVIFLKLENLRFIFAFLFYYDAFKYFVFVIYFRFLIILCETKQTPYSVISQVSGQVWNRQHRDQECGSAVAFNSLLSNDFVNNGRC